MTNQEQIIQELNSRIKANLGVSRIHGIGVFAIRGIKKGEKMYCVGVERKWLRIDYGAFGGLLLEVREIIEQRWPIVKQNAPFLHPNSEVWLLSFMNHSKIPNYNPATDEALEDILEGAEITENYCDMENAEKIYPWLKCEN